MKRPEDEEGLTEEGLEEIVGDLEKDEDILDEQDED